MSCQLKDNQSRGGRTTAAVRLCLRLRRRQRERQRLAVRPAAQRLGGADRLPDRDRHRRRRRSPPDTSAASAGWRCPSPARTPTRLGRVGRPRLERARQRARAVDQAARARRARIGDGERRARGRARDHRRDRAPCSRRRHARHERAEGWPRRRASARASPARSRSRRPERWSRWASRSAWPSASTVGVAVGVAVGVGVATASTVNARVAGRGVDVARRVPGADRERVGPERRSSCRPAATCTPRTCRRRAGVSSLHSNVEPGLGRGERERLATSPSSSRSGRP